MSTIPASGGGPGGHWPGEGALLLMAIWRRQAEVCFMDTPSNGKGRGAAFTTATTNRPRPVNSRNDRQAGHPSARVNRLRTASMRFLPPKCRS